MIRRTDSAAACVACAHMPMAPPQRRGLFSPWGHADPEPVILAAWGLHRPREVERGLCAEAVALAVNHHPLAALMEERDLASVEHLFRDDFGDLEVCQRTDGWRH